MRAADVEVDLDARRVTVGGAEVRLTTKEFEVLAALALMDEVWGDAFLAVSRSLDVHLTQVRAKLGRPEVLTTIRGFGYRFGD